MDTYSFFSFNSFQPHRAQYSSVPFVIVPIPAISTSSRSGAIVYLQLAASSLIRLIANMSQSLASSTLRLTVLAGITTLLWLAHSAQPLVITIHIPQNVRGISGRLCTVYSEDFMPSYRYAGRTWEAPIYTDRILACIPAFGSDVCQDWSADRESFRKIFKKAQMALHPDRGGNNEQFIMLQKQWDEYKNSGVHRYNGHHAPGVEGMEQCRATRTEMGRNLKLVKAFGVVLGLYPNLKPMWSFEQHLPAKLLLLGTLLAVLLCTLFAFRRGVWKGICWIVWLACCLRKCCSDSSSGLSKRH